MTIVPTLVAPAAPRAATPSPAPFGLWPSNVVDAPAEELASLFQLALDRARPVAPAAAVASAEAPTAPVPTDDAEPAPPALAMPASIAARMMAARVVPAVPPASPDVEPAVTRADGEAVTTPPEAAAPEKPLPVLPAAPEPVVPELPSAPLPDEVPSPLPPHARTAEPTADVPVLPEQASERARAAIARATPSVPRSASSSASTAHGHAHQATEPESGTATTAHATEARPASLPRAERVAPPASAPVTDEAPSATPKAPLAETAKAPAPVRASRPDAAAPSPAPDAAASEPTTDAPVTDTTEAPAPGTPAEPYARERQVPSLPDVAAAIAQVVTQHLGRDTAADESREEPVTPRAPTVASPVALAHASARSALLRKAAPATPEPADDTPDPDLDGELLGTLTGLLDEDTSGTEPVARPTLRVDRGAAEPPVIADRPMPETLHATPNALQEADRLVRTAREVAAALVRETEAKARAPEPGDRAESLVAHAAPASGSGVRTELGTAAVTEATRPAAAALDPKPLAAPFTRVVVPLTDGATPTGELRVTMRGPQLRVVIVADRADEAARLEQALGELREALGSRGFEDARVSVVTGRAGAERAAQDAAPAARHLELGASASTARPDAAPATPRDGGSGRRDDQPARHSDERTRQQQQQHQQRRQSDRNPGRPS